MKRFILSLILIGIACQNCFASERFIVPNNRFKISEYKVLSINNGLRLVVDNQTGREYLLYYNGDGVTCIHLNIAIPS